MSGGLNKSAAANPDTAASNVYFDNTDTDFDAINFQQLGEEIDIEKQDVLTFDAVPTDGSTNPVFSNGIYDAIQDVANAPGYRTTYTDRVNVAGVSTYTVDANLAYTPGARIRASANIAAASNYEEGVVTSYSGTTMVVAIDRTEGVPTATGNINLAGDFFNGTNGTDGKGYMTSYSGRVNVAGNSTYTVATNLAYTAGARIRASATVLPASNYEEGIVTSYAGTTLIVAIDRTIGVPTATGNINLAGDVGDVSTTPGPTGPIAPIATNQEQPTDPVVTTSLVGVMMGLAGDITPVGSGKVLIIISGDCDNTADAAGCTIGIRTGTGAAPTNGAALTGTLRGKAITTNNGDANGIGVSFLPPRFPFSVNAVVTGLTVGVNYWVDLSLAATIGGTARIRNVSISIMEG